MFEQLANAQIKELRPYIPGRPARELRDAFDLKQAAQLASNENSLGAGAAARRAAAAALREMHRYPDGPAVNLRRAIAKRHGVEQTRLILGNGSNEVLMMLAQCFLSADTSAMYSKYAFVVYPMAVTLNRAVAVEVPTRDWVTDTEAMARAIASAAPPVRMVFIANPNNPTGSYVDADRLRGLLQIAPPETLVVVDEAYCEYVEASDYPDTLALQNEYPNLITVRSFSKIHGLAALRLGYAIANAEIAELVNRIRQPFNVNHVAQCAAAAALSDSRHIRRSRRLNRKGMKRLKRGLDALGLSHIPSVGNFICFAAPEDVDASALHRCLLSAGVVIRPVGEVYDMEGYFRVTVGLKKENKKFLLALEQALAALRT